MATKAHRFGVSLLVLAAAVLAAGFVVVVEAEPAWAADRNLSPAPNSPLAVGSTPTTVTRADFDGDGKADLAAQNNGSNTVSVLMGNGDGTFQPKPVALVGAGPSAVTSADLDGDNKDDLAVSNQSSNTVSVLMGNGDGTFQPKRDYPVGGQPTSVISANLNADGFADIAVANLATSKVSVLLGQDLNGDNEADGTFAAQQDFSIDLPCGGFCIPATAGPNQVIAGRFNGDGAVDLATANVGFCGAFCTPGGVSVLLGSGNGSFQDAKLAQTGTTATSIAAYGTGDIVAAKYDSNVVSVLRSNGDGTFSTGQSFQVGSNPSAVTSADIDEDGVADLAVSNFTSDNVSVLWGTGGGGFQTAQNFPTGDGPAFVIGAQVDTDGFADLAVANQNSNNVSVLLHTTTPDPTPDTTAPGITLSTPSDGATYNLNQTVTADYSCQDEAEGSGVASCQGTVPDGSAVDTATAGSKTFRVSASDNAGNVSSVTHTYTVVSSGQCTLSGKSSTAETITGTAGDDIICGGAGPDTIRGMGGNDTLKGEAGNDTLLGGVGNDTLDGGLGTDTASYSASLTAVIASLATNSATGEGSDTFTGVENLLGSSKADTFTGSAANNTLTGGGGNDTGRGGAGNDKVVGNGGADSLYGEDGADAVNSKDGVNGNDRLDGGAGTDTRVTDTREASIVGFP